MTSTRAAPAAPTEPAAPPAPSRPAGGTRRRGPRRLLDERWLPYWTTPLLVAAFLALWKLYVESQDISEFVLPPPEEVARAFAEQVTDPFVWRTHVWTTFYETIAGFAIALVVGVGLGFLMGRSRIFETVANPFVVATQVVPKVALVPLFILWFGFGPTSKIAISAMLAFFPILTNTSFGVRSVPPSMREMMTAMGASRRQAFRKLEFKYTLAYILSGAEVGIVLAVIGAIVGEYLGGDRGLGRYAVNLQNNLQVSKLYGAINLMTIFGFVLYLAITGLRRFLIPWHESVLVRRRGGDAT